MIERRIHGQLLAAAVCFIGSAAVHAYSSYGLGNISCQDYLDRRAEDQQTNNLENTAFVHAYLSGYLTAGNTMRGLVGEGAQDISINIHKMVQWLDAKCLENREMKVAVALESFWVEAARARAIIERRDQSQQ